MSDDAANVVEFPRDRLAHLRTLLAEKFPETPLRSSGRWPTGVESVDRLHGGLPRGMLTEITGSPADGSLWIAQLLRLARRARLYAGLIDAGNAFDPGSHESGILEHFLWVACDTAAQAVRSADLLLRDANLPVLLLDLQTRPLRELLRIPVSTWHRFQRLVENTSLVFIILTPQPLVEGVRMRIALRSHWTLDVMCQRRRTLWNRMELQVFERGVREVPEPWIRTA